MKSTRLIELDLLRSAAIVCMIVYHIAYDLQFFYNWNIDVLSPAWIVFARATAATFLGLVGVSAALSYSRSAHKPAKKRWHKHTGRFLKIGTGALIISGVTYVIDPDTYVRFGILHLIAVSSMLLPLLAPLKERAGLLGVGILLFSPIMQRMNIGSESLIVLGLPPATFRSVDYFPLVPWFGVILIGYALGYMAYVRLEKGKGRRPIGTPLQIAGYPGRHALFLYLIHQPIIMGVLWILSRNILT